MENAQKLRAADSLMRRRLMGDKAYIPRIWIIGNELSVTYRAALRSQQLQRLLTNQKPDIFEMSVEEAYRIKMGEPMTVEFSKHVDWNIDQQGEQTTYEMKGSNIYDHIIDKMEESFRLGQLKVAVADADEKKKKRSRSEYMREYYLTHKEQFRKNNQKYRIRKKAQS